MRVLNSGDRAWIRDDLEVDEWYGGTYYDNTKNKGCVVNVITNDDGDELFVANGKGFLDKVYSYKMVDWDKNDAICIEKDNSFPKIKTEYFGAEPMDADVGDEWYSFEDGVAKLYEKTENGWLCKMRNNKDIHNLSMNIKTDSDFISMLFDGKVGTMVKQSIGTIEVKQKLSQKSVLDELKNIIKEFE